MAGGMTSGQVMEPPCKSGFIPWKWLHTIIAISQLQVHVVYANAYFIKALQ